MLKLKKDKLILLRELREIVSEELTKSHEIRLRGITEKRQNRKLKIIRKELDKWIGLMEEERKNDTRSNTIL